jgi:arylsulfatase A-like enzyme
MRLHRCIDAAPGTEAPGGETLFGIPRPIGIRVVVLSILLVLLKAVFIFRFADHVYQEHWRVTPAPQWANACNYWIFAGLAAAGSLILSRSLSKSSPGKTSLVCAMIACFGVIFAIFSRHQVDNCYVESVASGVLKWWQIGYYLEQDFLFAKPWLGIYAMVGFLGYYVLYRIRRESWGIPIFCGLFVVYLVLNPRQPMDYGDDLWLIDILGLAGLIGWLFHGRPPGWKAQLLLLLTALISCCLFAQRAGFFKTTPVSWFTILTVAALLAICGNFAVRNTGARSFVAMMTPFVFTAFLLLSSHHFPQAPNVNRVFIFGTMLPGYMIQEAVTIALFAFVCARLHRWRPRGSERLFDTGAIFLVALGLVDYQMTVVMGVRLDWQALIINNDPALLWRTVRPLLMPLVAGLAVCIGGYWGLLKAGGFMASRLTPGRAAMPRGWVFPTVLFILIGLSAPILLTPDKVQGSALGHILSTTPLFDRVVHGAPSPVEVWKAAQIAGVGEAVRYSREKLAGGKTPPRDLNVVLVILESAYNRYLSLFGAPDETQPLLRQYRDRMELFPCFYANFASSLNARFTVFSGLYGCSPAATYINPRIESPSLAGILHQHGYVTSVFDSSYRNYERWNDYLRLQPLDYLYDADNMPGMTPTNKVSWGLTEDTTLGAMKAQFALHAQRHEKFFLAYTPVMPHMPYDAPSKRFEKFPSEVGTLTKDYTGRYKNQLLYVDWVLAEMLNELKRLDLLDHTLVVITDDHGEMVGEDDHVLGHGWSAEPLLCNVPLILMDPAHPIAATNRVFGSQVDVLPTILDVLNLPVPTNGLYQGVSLYSPAARNGKRPIYIGSYRDHAMIRDGRYHVVPKSGDSPETTFEIRIEGTKSLFIPLTNQPPVREEVERFYRVQHNLILRNYYWKDHLPPAGGPP